MGVRNISRGRIDAPAMEWHSPGSAERHQGRGRSGQSRKSLLVGEGWRLDAGASMRPLLVGEGSRPIGIDNPRVDNVKYL